MSKNDYILETETYIENNKNTMPKNVFLFMRQVIEDERKYLELVNQYGNKK